MKKIYLLAALAAGLMASCSSEEQIPSSATENVPITFATNYGASATRSGVTAKSINSFTVSAQNSDKTMFFENVDFSYLSNSGAFQSATNFYWPATGTLSFYAISDPSASVSKDATTGAPQYSFTDWSGETDLLTATVKSGAKASPFPLTFQHVTSQIFVGAKPSNPNAGLTYKLLGIRMTTPCDGVYSFGSATGEKGTWEIDNEKTKQYSYADGIGNGITFSNDGSLSFPDVYWNILPNKDGDLIFEVEYEVYQSGTCIARYVGQDKKACLIESPDLQPGKKYTYNFLLSNNNTQVVKFSVEVSDWEEGDNTNNGMVPATSLEDRSPIGVQAVDLGLPSGIKWATMNVGATKPEERGLYFAWGKTEGYNLNGVGDYVFPQYVGVAAKGTLQLASDAANVYWGSKWRMPTYAELNELIGYCAHETVTVNGVQGMKFYKGTGTNIDRDTYIFFPNTGLYQGTLQATTGGYYWTSSCPEGMYAKYFCFSGSIGMSNGDFCLGMCIRPVRSK